MQWGCVLYSVPRVWNSAEMDTVQAQIGWPKLCSARDSNGRQASRWKRALPSTGSKARLTCRGIDLGHLFQSRGTGNRGRRMFNGRSPVPCMYSRTSESSTTVQPSRAAFSCILGWTSPSHLQATLVQYPAKEQLAACRILLLETYDNRPVDPKTHQPVKKSSRTRHEWSFQGIQQRRRFVTKTSPSSSRIPAFRAHGFDIPGRQALRHMHGEC